MANGSESAYSSAMETMVSVIGFILAGIVSQRWAVDSRPGLGDGRTDRVERWLPL